MEMIKTQRTKKAFRLVILSFWLVLACIGVGIAGVAPVERKRRHDELNIKPKTEMIAQKQKNEEKMVKN